MSDVVFVDSADLSPFPDWDNLLVQTDSQELISNVSTRVRLVRAGDLTLPITVNDAELENSWVCSPYNGAVTYPLEELRLIRSRLLRGALRATALSSGRLLKAGLINRVVCVNNRLLSTNLYPQLRPKQIAALIELLVQEYPGHAILFRSLNTETNSGLISCLQEFGCLMAPSRQVYFYDGRKADYLNRSDTRRDLRLLRRTRFRLLSPDRMAEADPDRVRDLYRLLYVDKYSAHNPQFTSRLIECWLASGSMRVFGLVTEHGRLDGVVGSWIMDGVRTVPLVGYDTAQPQSTGLYRMLMAQVLEETAQRNEILNLSAGAAHFKRLRGGRPVLESSAVYCRHLGLRQRMTWRMLAMLLNRIGRPILQKLEL